MMSFQDRGYEGKIRHSLTCFITSQLKEANLVRRCLVATRYQALTPCSVQIDVPYGMRPEMPHFIMVLWHWSD